MGLFSLNSHGILNVKYWLLSCHSRDLSNQMDQQKWFRYLWHMRKCLLWMPMLTYPFRLEFSFFCLSLPLLHEQQGFCETACMTSLLSGVIMIKMWYTGTFKKKCFCLSILGARATRECNGGVSSGCGKMSTGLFPGQVSRYIFSLVCYLCMNKGCQVKPEGVGCWGQLIRFLLLLSTLWECGQLKHCCVCLEMLWMCFGRW